MKTAMKSLLNSEQITMLQEGQLSRWSDESIIKDLKFRNALSVHGYNYLRSTGYPLPAYSTLFRRIQNFKLNFGIFDGIFDVLELLKFEVETMDPTDRYCILSYDEMVILAQQDYDKNNGTFSGYVTLGQNKDVLGQKIYLVLVRRVKNHWKQILACHVTPKESIDFEIVKEFIEKCIVYVEKCGLYVLALSSDLDARNRSLWSSMGITIMKYVPRVNSFHFNEHDIYAMPNVCHILKNLKSARLRQEVFLPEAYVEQEKLPSNVARGSYVKMLWEKEIREGREVRRLYHLRLEDINPITFDKMNVGAAVRFFSLQTEIALKIAVGGKELPEEALTTAAFIGLIREWFSLVSSKIRQASITLRNCDQKYIFLHKIIDLFKDIVFQKNWKPLNYAMILSTLSFADMAEFLFKNKFEFALGHRFTQDATENIFSQIRRKEGQMPTVLQCLRAIKMIQFLNLCPM